MPARHRLAAVRTVGRDAAAGGNGLRARVAKVETAIEHIRTDVAEVRRDLREIKRDARLDFRLLFGALIVTALGLAGIVARGFGWL